VAFDYDETNPTGSMFLADFPANEQAHRLAVVSSALVDHDAEGLGEHTKTSLQPHTGDPAGSADAGFVYTKTAGGITELFYQDDTPKQIQLTEDGSASPDKLPLAGGTMTGDITMDGADLLMEGVGLIKLLNAKAIQARDQGDTTFRSILMVDGSDVTVVGNQNLAGGTRLNSDGEDELVAAYGSGDKKIWHAGHFANPPIATAEFESSGVAFVRGDQGIHTVAHNLTFIPKLWIGLLKCVSAWEGYSIDDEIPLMSTGVAGTPSDVTISVDDTNFYYRTSNATINLMKDNGGSANIEDGDWEVVFRAWY
jgi:hypothetical protein